MCHLCRMERCWATNLGLFHILMLVATWKRTRRFPTGKSLRVPSYCVELMCGLKALICSDKDFPQNAYKVAITHRFFDELTGSVIGACKVGAEVELRVGTQWVAPLAPGTTPKEAGDMCALQLDKEGGACVLSDFPFCSGEGEGVGGELSLSFWIRTIDTRTNCEILSFATAAAPKEVLLTRPGEFLSRLLEAQPFVHVHSPLFLRQGRWSYT
jgi:hypothetical protein